MLKLESFTHPHLALSLPHKALLSPELLWGSHKRPLDPSDNWRLLLPGVWEETD